MPSGNNRFCWCCFRCKLRRRDPLLLLRKRARQAVRKAQRRMRRALRTGGLYVSWRQLLSVSWKWCPVRDTAHICLYYNTLHRKMQHSDKKTVFVTSEAGIYAGNSPKLHLCIRHFQRVSCLSEITILNYEAAGTLLKTMISVQRRREMLEIVRQM